MSEHKLLICLQKNLTVSLLFFSLIRLWQILLWQIFSMRGLKSESDWMHDSKAIPLMHRLSEQFSSSDHDSRPWQTFSAGETCWFVYFDCDDKPMRDNVRKALMIVHVVIVLMVQTLLLCFVTVRSGCVSLSNVFIGLSCSQTPNSSVYVLHGCICSHHESRLCLNVWFWKYAYAAH